MSTLFPSGTVTFLFSDIEGSTRLWERYPVEMEAAMERHDRYLSDAIDSCNGKIVKKTGDGFHAVFGTAVEGVQAAHLAQKMLAEDDWIELTSEKLRARMGLYTGEASLRTGDYYGTNVNRAARLMAAAHGGQILLSAATANLVNDQLPEGASLLDLGQHRLKDLVQPEHIYQLNHPSLISDFPPIYTLDEYLNNLPVQLSSYIGREHEMAEVGRLLDNTRLLTLIGPGGTGKTRLALQFAADVLVSPEDKFPHGVWLAEFGSIGDPELVLETVAAVFNLRQQSNGPSLLDLITQYMKSKQLLLLLDNCEHLIEACAQLADHLLRTCPKVKIIASSREALSISGETIFSVPSLSLPKSSTRSPDELLQSEAVQLFVERATAAQPNFLLTEQNAPAVNRICRRLDGIPLALELAAARVKVFTPEQIAARMDDRFRLLTGGSRMALQRQQTLSAMIDWSYDLLSKDEQELLRRLSVFAGGWSFEAAESICMDLDVLYLLTNLVNKSLVIVNEQVGESRYSFLETIRQYALDKLMNSGESFDARDRHLDYFLRFTSDSEQKIFFADSLDNSLQWLDRLDADFENIRAAVEWGIANRPVDALLLAGSIHFYIGVRGSPREGVRWLQEAISAVEQLPPVDRSESERRRMALARGWIGIGQLTIVLGESISANAAFDKGIPVLMELEDHLPLAIGLFFKTSAAFFMNDLEGARRAVEAIWELAQKKNDPRWHDIAMATRTWVSIMPDSGEKQHLAEYTRSFAQFKNPLGIELQLMAGFEARLQGDFEVSRMYLEQALQYIPIYRSKSFEAMTLSELGHVNRQTGDFEAANEIYCKTIRLWDDLGHRAAIANQLECFAFLARAKGNVRRALRLLAAAEVLRQDTEAVMTDYERPEYEQEIEALRRQVRQDEFEQFWSEGRRMGIEDAIELAVTEEN
jgi:predicted ATPase/class 3 adenylate cyclase